MKGARHIQFHDAHALGWRVGKMFDSIEGPGDDELVAAVAVGRREAMFMRFSHNLVI
ncbi:Uncharacterised protein [Mycobacteroides abscessus subsp. abscessus]|nr:Uncharacterised protein [Mycobacteroides abscessus subsp. abscessus]